MAFLNQTLATGFEPSAANNSPLFAPRWGGGDTITIPAGGNSGEIDVPDRAVAIAVTTDQSLFMCSGPTSASIATRTECQRGIGASDDASYHCVAGSGKVILYNDGGSDATVEYCFGG